jgi:hypothetical protein
MPKLREFLRERIPLPLNMPKLQAYPQDGRVPTGDRLKRLVRHLLQDRPTPADAVIALTDVYTGTREFTDAADAKEKMRTWVGPEPRFYPHVAQHDFEAWLIPFWEDIQSLAGSNRGLPSLHPETINHNRPPAHLLKEIFRAGSKGKAYVKPRDAARILRDNRLEIAARICPELKAFLNTLLSLCEAEILP